MRGFLGVLGAALLLAGCQSGAGLIAAPPAAAPPAKIILADRGILVAESGLEIGFGRTEASTIAAVTKLIGTMHPLNTPPVDVQACGRVYRWGDALRLHFVAGDFRGWTARVDAFEMSETLAQDPRAGWVTLGRTCEI